MYIYIYIHTTTAAIVDGGRCGAERGAVATRTKNHAGDVGIIENSDMLFTVQGSTAEGILMEWNVKEETQGSVAMRDSYFRVGGTRGSLLDASACPKSLPDVDQACIGASLMFHLTPGSSDTSRPPGLRSRITTLTVALTRPKSMYTADVEFLSNRKVQPGCTVQHQNILPCTNTD